MSDNPTKVCPRCGQRWWCYNDYHRLWSMISDDLTWECLLQKADYPIAIGDVSEVQFIEREKFVKPATPVCRPPDAIPYYKVKEINGVETPGIQWIGEYAPENILRYQFFFPLACPVIEGGDMYVPFIQAGYVGTVGSCPNKTLKEQIKKHFPADKYVAYIAGTNPAIKWKGKPVSFVCEIVLLGDSNVGIIRPQHYPKAALKSKKGVNVIRDMRWLLLKFQNSLFLFFDLFFNFLHKFFQFHQLLFFVVPFSYGDRFRFHFFLANHQHVRDFLFFRFGNSFT